MIALLGATGYVGEYFVKHLNQEGLDFLILDRKDTAELDVDKLTAKLKNNGVKFLVCAAGFTGKPNVDACEYQKSECLLGNAVLPGFLSNVAAEANIRWGHVSSGCIYNGPSPNPQGFKEIDTPNFSFRTNDCSFYSGTKALGEEILSTDSDCYIWRLRIPFSEIDSSRNYLSKVMRYERLLDAENSLSNLDDYVQACLQCITESIPAGVYNLTNPGSVTTQQVTTLLKEGGLTDKEFQFFDSEAEFMRVAAITPRSNCVLDTTKATDAGLKMPSVQDALNRCIANWRVETQTR